MDVTVDGHLERTGQGLEDALNLVVLVVTLGLDVEVDAGGIAERLEEVQEHLGRHIPHLLAVELGLPHQPGTTREVEGHLAETIVHGQAETVAANATLVAQRFGDTLTQGNTRIFDGVVLIHLEISLDVDSEIHARMFADLLQHVVEET